MMKIKAYILLIWFILSILISILISLKYKDFEVLAIINMAFPLIFIISDEEMIEGIKEDKNYHVLQILTKEEFERRAYKVKE